MNQAISITKYESSNALIFDKFSNPSIRLHSIEQLLDLMDKNNIDASEIQHLIIPNNAIRNIAGIEHFSELKELNLIGNRISVISQESIDYFKSRVHSYSSPESLSFKGSARRATFILLLNQNPLKNTHLFYDLIEENNVTGSPSQFIKIAESINELKIKLDRIENEGKSHKESIRILWEYGSKSNYVKTLLMRKIENVSSYQKVTKIVDFEDFHEIVRRGVYFITDVAPSEKREKSFFSSQEYSFYKGIHPKTIQDKLKSSQKEDLEKRTVYFHKVHLPTLNSFLEYFEEKSGEKLDYLKNLNSKDESIECNSRKLHYIQISSSTTVTIFLYYLATSTNISTLDSFISFSISFTSFIIAYYFWTRRNDKSLPAGSFYELNVMLMTGIGIFGAYNFNIEVAILIFGIPFSEWIRSNFIGGLNIKTEIYRIYLGITITLISSWALSYIVYLIHSLFNHNGIYFDHFHPIYPG